MKKNLALLLAISMLVGCMLAIVPAASATDGAGSSTDSYEPKIAYTNVNYTDDLVLMFAVPAPEDLEEGSSVKVLIWDAESNTYSYKNTISTSTNTPTAIALNAEEAKVTIGGAEHLVFKYYDLTPDMMTDIVYARAVVVDKDGNATAYGDVIDYSVVEYVETAKGGFNGGSPVITNPEVLDLLDSMLLFGANAQDFAGGSKPYLPNGYYANDELHKIWVTPVVAGQKFVKAFGGFFKYEEGGYATVHAPFFDGLEAVSYKDNDGNLLTDANTVGYDEAAGFQVNAVDSDIEIIVEYDSKSFIELNANDFGEGFQLDNVSSDIKGDYNTIKNLGINYKSFTNISVPNIIKKLNLSGLACTLTSNRMNYYHGFRTVADPNDENNLVFLVAITNKPEMHFQYIRPTDYPYFGYGDTLDEALTIEFELGKYTDAPVNTRAYKLVYSSDSNTIEGYTTSNHDLNLFRITNDKVYLLNGKSDNAENGTEICTLTKDRLTKIAITLYGDGTAKAYCSDENGKMNVAAELELVMPDKFTEMQNMHQANLADDNPDNNDDLLGFASLGNWLSMHTLYSNWQLGIGSATNAKLEEASVMINGVDTPLKNADGTFNMDAVQAYAEENYSFLLGYFRFSMGATCEIDEDQLDNTILSVTGEDFGEGFAFNNLTGNIGNYAGNPAKIAAMGATYNDPDKLSLNAYRSEKLFRRAWFDGNIGGAKFFQGFKTVADPSNPNNLVLQITSANANTLDLETIKPEELAKVGWGADGAITLELEIGKSNPDTSVNTRVFQIHRRTDENPGAAFTKNSQFDLFKVTNDEIIFYGGTDTVIGTVPNTGFVKIAFVINGNGVIKAYCSNADGAMVYAGEKDFSQLAMFASEDFASWMSHVITPRWYVGSGLGDADIIQSATVEIDGAQVPVYADGAYNEAALQVYMETYHSFLLDNFKISGKALYE